MNKTVTIIAAPVILIISALSFNLVANQPSNADASSAYRMLAFDQCQRVADIPLNELQIKHYLAMQDIEDKMHLAEQPLQALDTKVSALSHQLEELTTQLEELTTQLELEYQSNWQPNGDTMVNIETISAQIERVMSEHQPHIEHLEATASKIEQVANDFEHAINASLNGLTYQQIEILTPSKPTSGFKCVESDGVKS